MAPESPSPAGLALGPAPAPAPAPLAAARHLAPAPAPALRSRCCGCCCGVGCGCCCALAPSPQSEYMRDRARREGAGEGLGAHPRPADATRSQHARVWPSHLCLGTQVRAVPGCQSRAAGRWRGAARANSAAISRAATWQMRRGRRALRRALDRDKPARCWRESRACSRG